MNIDNKKIIGIGLLAGALGLFLWTRKAEAACEEGETKCVDVDLYACVDGKWELAEANSPQCVPPPPECEEGDTKCVGTDLYTCVAGEWQLTESNSDSCKVGPLPPLPPGFEIDKIAAEPPIVILGNPVKIKVNWVCPGLIEFWIDRELSLQCVINGETLQLTWTYTGSTSIAFEYTPTSIGTYTATIQGNGISKFNCPESVSFEVREEVVGPFYSPYGELCSWTPSIELVCKPANTPYATLDALANEIAVSTVRKSKPAPGAGRYTEYYPCPYCSKTFTSCTRPAGTRCSPGQRLAAAYKVLEHIQASHPDQPLTEPRNNL